MGGVHGSSPRLCHVSGCGDPWLFTHRRLQLPQVERSHYTSSWSKPCYWYPSPLVVGELRRRVALSRRDVGASRHEEQVGLRRLHRIYHDPAAVVLAILKVFKARLGGDHRSKYFN